MQGGVSKVWLEQIIALPSAMALAPVQRTEMGGHKGHCFPYVIIPGGVSQFTSSPRSCACIPSAAAALLSLGVFFFFYISKDNQEEKNVALKLERRVDC